MRSLTGRLVGCVVASLLVSAIGAPGSALAEEPSPSPSASPSPSDNPTPEPSQSPTPETAPADQSSSSDAGSDSGEGGSSDGTNSTSSETTSSPIVCTAPSDLLGEICVPDPCEELLLCEEVPAPCELVQCDTPCLANPLACVPTPLIPVVAALLPDPQDTTDVIFFAPDAVEGLNPGWVGQCHRSTGGGFSGQSQNGYITGTWTFYGMAYCKGHVMERFTLQVWVHKHQTGESSPPFSDECTDCVHAYAPGSHSCSGCHGTWQSHGIILIELPVGHHWKDPKTGSGCTKLSRRTMSCNVKSQTTSIP